MNRDPRCVFVADDSVHASCVIAWLEQHGIVARAVNLHSRGIYDVLAPFAWTTVTERGVEVWVEDPKQTDEAMRLLTDRELARVSKEAEAEVSDETIPVVCDRCGKLSVFPGDLRGTCQDCPHCGAYVDVGEDEVEPRHDPADERPTSDGIQRPPYLQSGPD